MKHRLKTILVLGLVAAAGSAAALPLGLPGPSLPPLPGPGSLGGQVGGALDQTVDNTVGTVRRDLVGRPRLARAFERDEQGARVVRGTILATGMSDAALTAARGRGFSVVRSDALGSLGVTLTVLRAPSGMDLREARKALQDADPAGTYEYDHVYDPAGGTVAAAGGASTLAALDSTGPVGVIDGGIDLKHSAFAQAVIETFNAASKANVPTAHGTAVASLLVGDRGSWHGALPHAHLYAADVFGGLPDGGSADAIARGLSWLADNHVAVINISLCGPPNKIVAAAIAALVQRGFVIVAAVGNDGPAVPVSFPAAYNGVIAVTSVDASRNVQLDANRGPAVVFASQGVDIRVARPGGGFGTVTGTSFAAPVVAANFATLLDHPDPGAARAARARLEHEAIDLGQPGRDPVTGYGFLAAPGGTQQAAVR